MLLMLSASTFAVPEARVWILKDGTRLEASLVYWNRGEVLLKPKRGKVIKVPDSNISEEDLSYIELETPPQFEFDFSKSTTRREYPPVWNGRVNIDTFLYTCRARITARSSTPYRHPMTAEMFIIGQEVYGGKDVLFYHHEKKFTMEDLQDGELELISEPVKMTEFMQNNYMQGEKYEGFLITITDSRGKIIAHKGSSDRWLPHIDNLRNVPWGITFDESCNACMPTRPKKWY